MKRTFASLMLTFALFAACTDAPESDEATTSEAKEVSSSSDDPWKVKTSDSKIEWIGTKVTGYHTGEVPVKSGELYVKDGAVAGGKFVMDVAGISVSGPKSVDDE